MPLPAPVTMATLSGVITDRTVPSNGMPMKILVTGAAGFLGTRLIQAILAKGSKLDSVSRIIAADIVPCQVSGPRVDVRTGSIAEAPFVDSLAETGIGIVFHLAAILSG